MLILLRTEVPISICRYVECEYTHLSLDLAAVLIDIIHVDLKNALDLMMMLICIHDDESVMVAA